MTISYSMGTVMLPKSRIEPTYSQPL